MFALISNISIALFCALLGACAIWTLLSMLLSWENRRFAKGRFKKSIKVRAREHRVALFVPCKGDDGDLEQNLACFFKQTHPNFELVLIVESCEDSAVPIIQKLQRQFPQQDCRLVLAGIAGHSGQKVHNLIQATAQIDSDVRIMAFADADIRPTTQWLQLICWGVCKMKNATANTGYRWMLPERNTLPNLFLSSINSAVAGSMGSGGHFLVWGGSWAMRRSYFDRLEMRERWAGTLSDDLVASQVIFDAGERVVYEPRCLCSTPFDMTWSQAIEFSRRQYVIGRIYAKRMFWSAFAVTTLSVLTWWTSLIFAVLWAGTFWGTLAVATLGVTFVCSVAKGWLRQDTFRRSNPEVYAANRVAAWFDIFATPLVASFNWMVMVSALNKDDIVWRENHYRIYRDGQIEWLNRPSISADVGSTGECRRAA